MTARSSAVTGVAGREFLRALPLRWPWLLEVSSDADRATAPGKIGAFPVVAKAEGIAHRQQVSGIWRDIPDARTAELVLELFTGSFGYPLSLAELVPHHQEYVVGWQHRAAGEDVLMFGEGGSDVGGAVEFRLLPLTRREARSLVAEHIADRAQRARLVALILALQDLVTGLPAAVGDGSPAPAAAGPPSAIDLNPVTFDNQGELIALDWKVFRGE
jgi:hypothetical protein